ncbi:MAG: oligosaccharide flippase family protein [Bacteroidales bacterium]|nr:oligosaccharide flippase family protein [Bacteroidales bacterium]
MRTISAYRKIIIGFFMLPFLIHNLGDSLYGLWILVMSFMSYYTLLRMGLSSAVSRFLSQAVGKNNEDEMSMIASTAFFPYLGISLIMVLATLVLLSFGTSVFSNVKQYDARLFKILILILGINTAIAPPMSVFGAVLVSHLKYTVGEIINIAHLLMINCLIFLFISLGKGLIFIALTYFFCNLAKSIYIFFYIKKKHSEVTIKWSLFSRKQFKVLFTFSFFAFISQLAETLRYKLDTIVITIFIGLAAITYYNIASSMINYFSILIIATIGVFGNYVSQEEGRGDFNSIREKFRFLTKINAYMSFFVGCSMIFYGKEFIQRWMGVKYTESYTILLVLVIGTVINLSQYVTISVLVGISKNKFIAYSNLAEGAVNLLLSIILVQKHGLLGVALGTAIPMIVVKLFIQPWYLNKVLRSNLKDYYILLIRSYILSAIILGLYYLITRNFISSSYINIILLFAIQAVIFSIVIYFIGFSRDEMNRLLALISH